MKTKLIADAGSTKVEWTFLASNGSVIASVKTEGINAILADPKSYRPVFEKVVATLPHNMCVEEVDYYGAGCATPEICDKMKDSLLDVWNEADISVSSDLLGAARAIFGTEKGIVCILGTGSNSCLYDGSCIICQIPSLGYVLGDEGSGAALGKRLLSDALKHQLPEDICKKFLEEYDLTLPLVLDQVYRYPAPNRFLASMVPFLKENLWNPDIYSLVLDELTCFVKRNVAMYPRAHTMQLGFIGSIAFHFERVLREATASLGYSVSKIDESPMPGLIEFHKKQQA